MEVAEPVEAIVAEPEPLEVRPVGPAGATEAGLPGPTKPSSDPVNARIDRYNVYAMLVNACRYYQRKGAVILVWLSLVPILVVCGAVLSFLLTWAAYGLTTGMGYLFGDGTNYLLYGLLLFALGFASLFKDMFEEADICFSYEGDTPDQIQLGKLEHVLGIASPLATGVLLGACFGFQVGLLYFTLNHGGLDDAGGLGHCFLLTLDNFLHGALLDTCELYNINFAGRVEHGWISATLFYIFRLAFDASTLLLFYQYYQRRRASKIFDHYPEDDDDQAQFADWLVRVYGEAHGWPRLYFDEFTFLLIAGHYLRGENDRVRQLTREFPRLRVTADVRAHFVDDTGAVIFESVR
jgi:hypothetical protein